MGATLVAAAPVNRVLEAPTPQAQSALAAPSPRAETWNAERRNEILEARAEVLDNSYSIFAILMGGLGVLITLLVVAFGIFSHRTAVMAARQELADMHDKVQALHDAAAIAKSQIDELLEIARGAATGAQEHQRSALAASEVIANAASFAERLMSIDVKDDSTVLTRAERHTVDEAVRQVGNQPENEWTADVFRVKILDAHSRGDWPEVIRLSKGMEFLIRDPESLAFAMFQQALALEKMNRNEAAIAHYEDLERQFEGTDNVAVRGTVEKGCNNRGALFHTIGRPAEALLVYDAILSRLGSPQHPELQVQAAIALFNKACALGKLGRNQEAIDTLDRLIGEFADADTPKVAEAVLEGKAYRDRLRPPGENPG
jgi:tetratricopeptide (TPR) repeat protein